MTEARARLNTLAPGPMTTLDPIDTIFAKLDAWRHLPAYQLERRADIFFAVYLRDVLSAFTGIPIHEVIIPELPIKRDLIWPDNPSNQSVKVDYCLFAEDLSRVFFIELKTDGGSRRAAQDEYLSRAVEVGFQRIVEGIRDIVIASSAHQKYHHLVAMLSALGCLRTPDDLEDFLYPKPRPGLTARLREIEVREPDPAIEVIYIQPENDAGARCIDFETFAKHVDRHDDAFSQAFAAHLRRWTQPAGSSRPT